MNMQCNIWALEKDISIKHLLLMLTHTFGAGILEVMSPVEGHPQSISITSSADQSLYAYIYTYGQATEHYGIHLEFPSSVDSLRYDTTEIIENLTFERMVEILAVHFNIVNYKAN